MCGRAAQSANAVENAKQLFGNPNNDKQEASNIISGKIVEADAKSSLNLSPGMPSLVFHTDNLSSSNTIFLSEKIWGLVPKAGTKSSPLPDGPSKHYSNLMFNARSESLYEKKTFSNLIQKGKTCIWAVDGYYEWKYSGKNVLASKSERKKKQPYFVHQKNNMPILIAGLWTSVSTGRQLHRPVDDSLASKEKEQYLETFTILTIDSKKSLQWLHHRQPLMINPSNLDLVSKWLHDPDPDTLQTIMIECQKEVLAEHVSDGASNINTNCLRWHPVTKEMNNTQYQQSDCMDEVKVQVAPSIKSFFTKATEPKIKCSEIQSSGKQLSKRKLEASTISTTFNKKAKKGTLNQFFKKK